MQVSFAYPKGAEGAIEQRPLQYWEAQAHVLSSGQRPTKLSQLINYTHEPRDSMWANLLQLGADGGGATTSRAVNNGNDDARKDADGVDGG